MRKGLEVVSKGKSLSDPEVVEISNKLDREIIKFMKLMKDKS